MLLKKKILALMRQHREKLKEFGVIKIGLFGSFARSGQKRNSDLDILVEFDGEKKTFDNYMDLKFYLENLFHRKVDLVIKDTLKTRIKDKVLAEVQYA